MAIFLFIINIFVNKIKKMVPKGKLIAIGGNEDKGTETEAGFQPKETLNFFEYGILRRFVSETKHGCESRIEVLTTASSIPEEVAENYLKAFSRLSCVNVGHLDIRDREQVSKPEYIERIKNADAVMISGGNQLRLSMILGGTEIHHILINRLKEESDFVIAGTSAGAMAMSSTMIYQGHSSDALQKGEVKVTTGLALISNVVIDSHFVKRGRFGRLAQAVVSNPFCLGMGLGEDTGVIITENNRLETIGSGHVIIFNGKNIKHSNVAEASEGSPLSIENMVVHILAKGNVYYLKENKFLAKEVD